VSTVLLLDADRISGVFVDIALELVVRVNRDFTSPYLVFLLNKRHKFW
jgi:hypothetical protein